MLMRAATATRVVLVEMRGLHLALLPSSTFGAARDGEKKLAVLLTLLQMSELRQAPLTIRMWDVKAEPLSAPHTGEVGDSTSATTIGGRPARGAFV